jgi:putative membrane protein
MIAYNPKRWWRVVFSYRGTVLPAVIRPVAVFTLISLVLVLLDYYYDRQLPHIDPVGHTILGVVLGLLIVFRTNSSYERFWEGRRLWGQLVNASRSLARAAAAYAGPADDLGRLVAAFALALRHHLRGQRDPSDVRKLLPDGTADRVAAAANPPAAVAGLLSDWVARRVDAGRLHPALAAELEQQVAVLTDCQGGCERILGTPIPFAHAAHIKHLLLLYLGTLPVVLVEKMGFAAPVAVATMSFGLLGIQEAGLEIENPFGEDPNDPPLDDICSAIARDAAALTERPAGG